MKTWLSAFGLTLVVLVAGSFGTYWLATRSHGRELAWAFVTFAATVGSVAIATYVWSTAERFNELEQMIRRRHQGRSEDADTHAE